MQNVPAYSRPLKDYSGLVRSENCQHFYDFIWPIVHRNHK
uniref:Uncharacterized protein n=1 Tax=Rhizophora mucronata TaxID=61149 RepID=A0A2P2PTN6_RHIMU